MCTNNHIPDQDWFKHKIFCSFAVITHDADCHTVTKELAIQPHRFFNKGDEVTSAHAQSIGYRPYGLWEIQSELIIGGDENVSAHIKYFQELLGHKIEIIQKLKNQYHFECIFEVNIETESAGAGYDLSESELSFIAKIASRYVVHILDRERIDG